MSVGVSAQKAPVAWRPGKRYRGVAGTDYLHAGSIRNQLEVIYSSALLVALVVVVVGTVVITIRGE